MCHERIAERSGIVNTAGNEENGHEDAKKPKTLVLPHRPTLQAPWATEELAIRENSHKS